MMKKEKAFHQSKAFTLSVIPEIPKIFQLNQKFLTQGLLLIPLATMTKSLVNIN